jgi:hypothetical protein
MLKRTGGLDRRRVLDAIHLHGGGHVGKKERLARTVGRIGQTSAWSYTPSLYADKDRTHARINRTRVRLCLCLCA